jgi:DNA-binding NarL/FixJ family response regulator
MSKIRILLIEDNNLLRKGIVATVNAQSDMKIVASSAGYADAELKANTVGAQVILVDLSGLRMVTKFAKRTPEIKIIGMGLIPTQLDIMEFVKAGASGFIMKNAPVADFLATVRSVADGGKVIPPSLTHSLFSHVIEHALSKGSGQVKSAVTMTKREREIIALIADALSNKEIAQRLHIGTFTVKSHVHNILEKLALHSRLQIARHIQADEE